MTSRYGEVYAEWRADPQAFWAKAARGNRLDQQAGAHIRRRGGRLWPLVPRRDLQHVLQRARPACRGGARRRRPRSSTTARSPASKKRISYGELLDEVATLAAVLGDFGVAKGDRVIIYMPMVPEALAAMLACARIGAVHSVVFGGFAAKELATRIDDAQPKIVLTASCGFEPGRIVAYKPLLDGAIDLAAHKPDACLVLQRPQSAATLKAGRDHDWARDDRPPPKRPASARLASNSPPPIRSTSSTPPGRPACPKAWCATSAAIWSR